MSDINHPDYFPNLRFHTLEKYAHNWGESGPWPFIEKIVLYNPPVNYDHGKKYLLFFKLSPVTNPYDKAFVKLLRGHDWLTWLGEDKNDFSEIYKTTPQPDFQNEWRAITNKPKDALERHSWHLFSRKIKKTGINIINKVRVFIENEYEIGFQLPGKPAKLLNHQTLGFSRTTTNEWKLLIKTIQNSPHYFQRQGKYHQRINKKLVEAFKTYLGIDLPNNYHLYEQLPDEEKGTLRFKFQMTESEANITEFYSKYENLSEKELSIKLRDYSQRPNISADKLKTVTDVLTDKFEYDEKDFLDILKGRADKSIIKEEFSDIRVDPYENSNHQEPEY